MKKILSLVLALMLVLSLTACSTSNEGDKVEKVKEETEVTTTSPEEVATKEEAGEESVEETAEEITTEPEEPTVAVKETDNRPALNSMTWSQLTKSTTWEARATQTLEMLEITTLTKEDVVALGFSEPEDNPHLEVLLITFRHTIKNPTIKYSGAEEDRYTYFASSFRPDISGVEVSSGVKLIGAFHDFGFDGSLDREFDKAWETKTGNFSSKIKEGDELPEVFSYVGQAIVTVEKDRENFLYTVENRYESNEKQVTMKIK